MMWNSFMILHNMILWYFTIWIFYEMLHANHDVWHDWVELCLFFHHALTTLSKPRYFSRQPLRVASWQHFCPCQLHRQVALCRPRHGGLYAYFDFPFWHAANGQKRYSKDILKRIQFRLLLPKSGSAGGRIPARLDKMREHASLYFAHWILFYSQVFSTQPLLTRVLASSISCRGSWFTGSLGFPWLWVIGLIDEVGSDIWSSWVNSDTGTE